MTHCVHLAVIIFIGMTSAALKQTSNYYCCMPIVGFYYFFLEFAIKASGNRVKLIFETANSHAIVIVFINTQIGLPSGSHKTPFPTAVKRKVIGRSRPRQ
mgnify:CR=1 FL=1